MSKIIYNSGYIRPIETVSIAHTPIFSEEGVRLSNTYSINLAGKLLVNRGSPSSSGTFGYFGASDCENIAETVTSTVWLESLLMKRCALSNLLNQDYKELVIGTVAGTADLTCYPKVTSFTVSESDNPQYWPFTISFEADNLFCSGVPIEPTGLPRIKSFSETWEFNYSEDQISGPDGDNRVYNVSHAISAQGLRSMGAGGIILYSGIDAARVYVSSKIGNLAIQPVLAISGFDNYSTKYNYVDVHSIDIPTASYSVTESWIYTTGSILEEYTVEKTTTNSRTCPTVSVNGTITGLCIRNLGTGEVSTSKYTNALNYWNNLYPTGLKTRAQNLSGLTLNSNPVSTSVTTAPIAGTIAYNYEFQGGPTPRLSGAVWENISVSNTFGEDIYGNPSILGRGEIIQIMNSGGFGKLNTTSLSVDAVYPCSTGTHMLGPRFTPSLSGELQTLINSYNPYLTLSNVGYIAVDSQSESWNAYDSSYNYSVSWKWTYSGVCS